LPEVSSKGSQQCKKGFLKNRIRRPCSSEIFSGRLVAANQREGIQSQKKPASGNLPITG